MRDGLQRLIIVISASAWRYLLVLVLAAGSFGALTRIGDAFTAASGGAVPFDLQNGLRPADVYAQLAGYTPASRRLYFLFNAVDWLFPLAAGLFLAATIAFCLRYSLPRAYAALTARRLLPLLLAATAFDWLENVLAVTTVALYPTRIAPLPVALVAAKWGKLGSLVPAQLAMFALLAFTAGVAVVRRLRPIP